MYTVYYTDIKLSLVYCTGILYYYKTNNLFNDHNVTVLSKQ